LCLSHRKLATEQVGYQIHPQLGSMNNPPFVMKRTLHRTAETITSRRYFEAKMAVSLSDW